MTRAEEIIATNPVVGIVQKNCGERYAIHSDGTIGRPSIGLLPSGEWRIRRAMRCNNFGNGVEFWPASTLLANAGEILSRIEWKHANGAQRVYILDLDHGTARAWVSPGYAITTAPADWNPYKLTKTL